MVVCDRDHVIAVAGLPKKELLERRATAALEELMEHRKNYAYTDEEKQKLQPVEGVDRFCPVSYTHLDMHRANEVGPILKRLGAVAEQTGCAVVLIRHLNKMMGQKSGHRGMGSVDFQAAARSVLRVGRTKDDPHLRIVVPDKSSLAPEGDSIAFALDPQLGFHWKGYFDCKADELLGGKSQVQTKTMAAEDELKKLLAEPTPAEEVQRQITAMGISQRTLMIAKKNLGILSEKKGTQWFWKLPLPEVEERQGCKDVIL